MRALTTSRLLLCALSALAAMALSASAESSPTVAYRFSFPDAVHHVMQVEATFEHLPPRPLEVQMSRSSPGRYAAFEFASNVFEEKFTDGDKKPLQVSRPDPRSWTVAGHHGTVHVTYRLFGDKVDGTFFAIDTTHAHINFPATVMWAHGLDDSPVRITFALPPGSDWKIATQLYPTTDASTFTAPNLQYLMDSPAELSHFAMSTFQVPAIAAGGKAQTIRVVAHSQATDAEFNDYVAGAHKLVLEEQAVFGELPDYEPGYYTFLADALPWDGGDGMEHRNSTVMTGHKLSLSTVAHEFFHNWNVERIRPEGLEPFNFRDVNMSGEMFIAEGFTQYYGNLAMLRSGITTQPDGMNGFAHDLSYVLDTPGSSYRSAMDMSRLAPFVDGSSDLFPTYWNNDFVSYYIYGEVIALGLDLELRARSNSRITLDDFMRAMWRSYGKPGGPAPGLVGHPYNIADVQKQLAAVSGDPQFAADFVHRYIEGTEKLNYAGLFLKAGFVLRRLSSPASLGDIRLEKSEHGVRVTRSTMIGSPAYEAGLDLDDELISVAGTPIPTPDVLLKALASHQVGDKVELVFLRRGQQVKALATLTTTPGFELIPIESTGGTLTANQKQFRDAWLGSKVKIKAHS
ncbi:M61 family metallopeptidase [Silvibacterium acidisoli]|uniref:M61 family metallopeptidase n=1 Tax=Acidobacteriaceae bacterium ZG23-2 TaxID=2883246 RepID=UPI00406CC8F8